jgi:hypothetical protein
MYIDHVRNVSVLLTSLQRVPQTSVIHLAAPTHFAHRTNRVAGDELVLIDGGLQAFTVGLHSNNAMEVCPAIFFFISDALLQENELLSSTA